MAHVGWLLGAMAMGSASAVLLATPTLDAAHGVRVRRRRRLRLAVANGMARADLKGVAKAAWTALELVRLLPLLQPVADTLSRFAPFLEASEALRRLLGQQGLPCSPSEAARCLVLAAAAGGVSAWALMRSLAAVPATFAACLLVPVLFDRRAQRQRERLLKSQAPDALRVLDSAVCAGLSLPRAFSYAASCTDDPLGSELARVEHGIASGQSFDEALAELQARVSVPELVFVAVAMEVQHRSGGSMHAIIGVAIDSIRESFELERSLEVKTAQARLSANVVAAMPAILLGMLMVASPGYLSGFMGSTLGVAMLAVAVALDLAGLVAIKSFMDVEV